MNNTFFIKLTDSETNDVQFINFNLVTYFASIPDKGTSIHTTEGIEAAKETPEQIEAALKAAGIQVIDCGASVGEEPKKWFRVISDDHAVFKKGEKVCLSYDDGSDWKFYSNGEIEHAVFGCDLEPFTYEPTLTNDKN